ncbi:hypothetical protein MOX02_08290 [Methylobacterium oxalidis]|uniref:DUF1214 domain-containing protein n=2 Tax=Methylobacterium oxalidis TaxID=944322 RepID=A0A512IYJ9_9HYPH|nr:hypothetical protein MOX02_08290 [Methylobacterium oxalidis]GJE33778.1 hypothetical protein LDDCCGHA_3981 [Methylobacterium oxalidis]GLS66809.1 hypothetical protein GCM10007888_51920 [Methylobacterium oxalidis]
MTSVAETDAIRAPARPPRTGTRMPVPAAGLARRVRAFLRKTSRVGLVVYALGLGAGLGLVSADWATRGRYPFGGVTVGPWTAWPRAGASNADPYARAVNARRGEIPLAVGEGLLLSATTDDTGRGLEAGCRYSIAGHTPPARAWTLTVTGRGAPDPARPSLRSGFTSTEILRERDGRFAILLAPEAQAGNWLPSPGRSGALRLALRLYDTPVAAGTGSLDPETLPAITRLGCGA